MSKRPINQQFDILGEIRKFHEEEFRDLTQIIQNIERVEDEMKDKQDQCESYLNEIKGKRKDNEKYGNLSKGVLEGKNEEIKSKVKNIDSVSTGIKEVVAKVKVQKLSKLPVNKDRNLSKLFETLYETVYIEAEPFDWDVFNKLALKHQGGEDFISRLVNISFKDLSTKKYDKLMELKSDPQFELIATKSPYSRDIIDLADWVDYVCLGHKFSQDKKKLQKEYDKIRKDVDKKSKGNLQVNENFWKQASQQVQKYQNEIRNICSQLKAISFQLKKSSSSLQGKPLINFKAQQIRA